MNFVETKSEFDRFLNESRSHDWIVIPTYCNDQRPVYVNNISLLYVYVLRLDKEYTLIFNHSEGLQIPYECLKNLPTDNQIFVYEKKKLLQFISNKNLIDVNMVEYFYKNSSIEEDFDTSTHDFFVKSHSDFNDLNTIIPISKHIEKSQAICNRFLEVYEFFNPDDAFYKYNDLIIESLQKVEKNGLYINYELFKKKFSENKDFESFTYSEYNLYTSTGRPSNRFAGINFAALNKENGQRSAFVSRFGERGFMMSFDYDAYHIRLLSDLIDYSMPSDCSAHEYLGKYYFNKSELSAEEYQEAKSISFRQLYGGISREYLEIPFFFKVHEYTKLLWEKFKETGYIETPLFSRKLHSSFFTDMNAAKLLNYLLQSYETERNMAVIYNIHHRIQSFSSKLILYTYDSFLFDFDKRDGGKLIKILKEELEQNGKFPTKLEIGPDYHNMIPIVRKF